MANSEFTSFRVTQFARPDDARPPSNIGVSDLDSLVTHHPVANRRGQLVDGIPKNVEHDENRSYAVVGGEFQEVQALRTDQTYRSLGPDQILLIKDFILDDTTAANSRRVDVPAPVAGVVGRVDARNGVVDICEPADGRLIARIRHLGPIAVEVGDRIAYGQSLGTQNNIGLPASAGKHVHIEMDTRHYQQLDHYIRDLVDGRLPVQAAHRVGVEPRPIVDDGVQRVGEAGTRVADVQRALVAGDYRGVGDVPIAVDGVYRQSIQGAVLAFQLDQGLPQTGDIDAPTWRAALDLSLGRPTLPPPVRGAVVPGALHGNDTMLEQIRGHVGALDPARGSCSDADAERLAHALLRLARERKLDSVDHVLLSQDSERAAAGERIFLVQGRLADPAHLRASMPTGEALRTSVVESMEQLQALVERQRTVAQPQLDPNPTGPTLEQQGLSRGA